MKEEKKDNKKNEKLNGEKFAILNMKASQYLYDPQDINCPNLKKAVVELQHQMCIHLNMLITNKDYDLNDIYNVYTDILVALYGEKMYFASITEYLKEKHGTKVFKENLIQRGFEYLARDLGKNFIVQKTKKHSEDN